MSQCYGNILTEATFGGRVYLDLESSGIESATVGRHGTRSEGTMAEARGWLVTLYPHAAGSELDVGLG